MLTVGSSTDDKGNHGQEVWSCVARCDRESYSFEITHACSTCSTRNPCMEVFESLPFQEEAHTVASVTVSTDCLLFVILHSLALQHSVHSIACGTACALERVVQYCTGSVL